MRLSIQQVKHVARLARLSLTAGELEKFAAELTVILDYIDQLKSVDTNGVKWGDQFVGTRNVFREDAVTESLPREEALCNAPRHDGNFFLVPKVLG